MNICEKCGWPITEGTKHEGEGEVCLVKEIDTGKQLGWKRGRDIYRKR